MGLVEWDTLFRKVPLLVCDQLTSNGEHLLLIALTEYHLVKGPGQAEEVKPGDSFEELWEKATPVEETADSRKWQVIFEQVVAFKASSETFYFYFENELRRGKRGSSFLLQPSPWIKDLEENGVLASLLPECDHYVIFCQNSIIEVIAADDPFIFQRFR